MYPARRMMRLGLLTGLVVRATAGSRRLPTPALTLKPCRLEHPARMLALPAECGIIRSRRKSRRSPTAARSSCSSRGCRRSACNKAPDPLFLIAGGPGTSAVDLYTSSCRRRSIECAAIATSCWWISAAPAVRIGSTASSATRMLFERIDQVEVGPENIKCRDDLSKNSDLRYYTTSIAVQGSRRGAGCAGLSSASISMAAPMARAWPSTTRGVIRKPRAR